MSTLIDIKKIRVYQFFKKGAHFLYKFVVPKSEFEDDKRREFILNVLLLCSIVLATTALFIVSAVYFENIDLHKGNNPIVPLSVSLFFIFLYYLSRRGLFIQSSYILVSTYFLLATYSIYSWGVDLTQGLLIYVLVIVMSSVLISTRVATVVTFITSITILVLTYLQNNFITHPDLYWKREMLRMYDMVVVVVTFNIIMLVSWLSNREIEKSLRRARRAERDLRKERDSLEINVKERTREIEHLQFEKTKQMQSFVNFGRIASGLFHDLMNPVQAVMLAIESIKNSPGINKDKELLSSANMAVKQMSKAKEFINMARNQINNQEIHINFDPEEQILLVFQMLSFKARKEKVELIYTQGESPVVMYGNPLSFNRLISGLVSNAIDSYDDYSSNKAKIVKVFSEHKYGEIIFSVEDKGRGISEEHKKHIFDLFFSTKGMEKGTGVGLYLCKEIVEKEFGGKISFKGKEDEGTTFTVEIPYKE